MYFRVDGNDIIATGHIMRCLAIAAANSKLGEESVFIIADDYPKNIIEKHGYRTICLNSTWNKLDTETEKLIECIKRENIQKLLIDSYYVTKEYLEKVRQYTTLIYIDDLNQMQYPVDVLICYSNPEQTNYNELYNYTDTKLWLGREYTPLREEFFDCSYKVRDKAVKVFLTTGGTDPYDMSLKIAKMAVQGQHNIELYIIAGKYNKKVSELMLLQEKYPKNIHVFQKVNNMSELMQECDIAISAGGTTLFELCACKIPTVCFALADNQLDLTEDFGNNGIMVNAGDIRGDTDEKVGCIYERAVGLLDNYKLRKAYSDKMSSVVDGKGAIRLAEKIINLKEK